MKIVKTLLAMSAAALIITGCATEPCGSRDFEDRGLISGWKFTPLQIAFGLSDDHAILFDESTDTFFSFGFFCLQQKSAVLSFATIANGLIDNYAIQITPFGSTTRNNYGLLLGLFNFCNDNYGVQIGALFNESFTRSTGQYFGINIADKVQIGGANLGPLRSGYTNPFYFQLGAFNYGDTPVQIGALNYNPRSPIPLLPLVNFAMKKDAGE